MVPLLMADEIDWLAGELSVSLTARRYRVGGSESGPL